MSTIIAALHFIGLGLSFTGVSLRIQGIRQALRTKELRGVFLGDNIWGIAGILILVTGLLRAFGGYEKGSSFYLQNSWFHFKLSAFILIVLLEIYPMIQLIKWRISRKTSLQDSEAASDLVVLKRTDWISKIELVLLFVIVFLAAAMTRIF